MVVSCWRLHAHLDAAGGEPQLQVALRVVEVTRVLARRTPTCLLGNLASSCLESNIIDIIGVIYNLAFMTIQVVKVFSIVTCTVISTWTPLSALSSNRAPSVSQGVYRDNFRSGLSVYPLM